MAALSILKVRPAYIVGLVLALIVALLLWARRTNILANASSSTDVVVKVAQAIAGIEGFYTGGRAAKNHNPGDLTEDLTKKGVGKDGMFIIYATDQDGWDALYKQVGNFFTGSARYNPSMSILETAQRYTPDGNSGVWANYVASELGVPVTTTWSELA